MERSNTLPLAFSAIAFVFVAAQPISAQPAAAQPAPRQQEQKPNGDAPKKDPEKTDPGDDLSKQIDEALKLLEKVEMAPKLNPRQKADARKAVEKFDGPPRPARAAVAPFVTDDAIKIDGDLSDWKDLRPIALEPIARGKAPKVSVVQPDQQRAWLAHCPKGLIVAVEVVDTSGELENGQSFEGNFWLNDCLEIYVDGLNTKSPTRGEPHVHQFFAFPFGSRNDQASGGYEAHMFVENGRLQTKRMSFPMESLQRAAKKTEAGWTMEILIPKSTLRKGEEVGPGRTVGFNLQLDTGTNLFYFWNGAERVQTSMRPNTWGDVQLLGTDAKVELFPAGDPAKAEALKSLVPGQVVKIRVTDPDMNLDGAKKDKLSVAVRVAAGDAKVEAKGEPKTAILEETGDGTGIFEGSIRFDALEGDRVTVEYVDQARAAGEGNVPVRVVVPVAGPSAK